MKNISFEWDVKKAATNLKKHGVSFDEAKSVFYDDLGRVISDPDHSEEEQRFILMGLIRQLDYSLCVIVIEHMTKLLE